MYSCQAANAAGKRVAIAFLTVKSPPVFIDEPERTKIAKLGSNTRLDCPTRADPAPVITWTKDNQVKRNT